jgi:hypothetical protein
MEYTKSFIGPEFRGWVAVITWSGINWTDLAQGPVDGSCEHENEHSRSVQILGNS